MRILGIDPGIATVGFGFVDQACGCALRPVQYGAITTEAGLPRLNMRDLRYMFARFLLEQDFSLEAVSGMLGHTKQTTTVAFCKRIPCTDPEVGAVVAGSLDPVLGAGKKEGKNL